MSVTKQAYQTEVAAFVPKLDKFIRKFGWYPDQSLATQPLTILKPQLNVSSFPKMIWNIFDTWHPRFMASSWRMTPRAMLVAAVARFQRIVGHVFQGTRILSVWTIAPSQTFNQDEEEFVLSGEKAGQRHLIYFNLYDLLFQSPELWRFLADCEAFDMFLIGTKSRDSSIFRFVRHELHERECFRICLRHLVLFNEKPKLEIYRHFSGNTWYKRAFDS